MRRSVAAAALLAAALLGCGGAPPAGETAPRPVPAVKMRHQILFSGSGGEHVFEGYMLLAGDALMVKAFAGPGVDLFTVTRDGASHAEELHLPGLADRIDVTKVGADIARVYLGACPDRAPSTETTCAILGQEAVERLDADGRLVERRFPDAHGVGLRISYEEFEDLGGRVEPRTIRLFWGESPNRMVIRLVAIDVLDHVDRAVFGATGDDAE
jgi:hypothetical protein